MAGILRLEDVSPFTAADYSHASLKDSRRLRDPRSRSPGSIVAGRDPGVFIMNEFASRCGCMDHSIENRAEYSVRVPRLSGTERSMWTGPVQGGYSLIMLLVVMTIVGILAAVAVPGWKELVDIRLSSAVMKTANDLRYVQDLAMKKCEKHTVEFTRGGYRILGEDGTVIEDPSNHGQKFIVDLTRDYPGIAVGTTFPDKNRLSFNWRGEPSSGGRVILSLRGAEAQVYVESGTGRISF